MPYHIAQINIARMVAPLDSPVMHDFVANLDRINALAESASGFVWRLKGDGNDATSLRPYGFRAVRAGYLATYRRGPGVRGRARGARRARSRRP